MVFGHAAADVVPAVQCAAPAFRIVKRLMPVSALVGILR